MDPLIVKPFLAPLESNHYYSSYELKTSIDSQITNLEFYTRACTMSKLVSLSFLPCARSIRWIIHRMLERLDFAEFRILSGWRSV